MDRPRLALVIPTFRRSATLVANLAKIAEEATRLGVAIYISDDSPDDDTGAAVRGLADTMPGLSYRHNVPALGHDANLIASLTWPDADYVWLLGDALWVIPGCLTRIVAFLDDQDLLLVNSHSGDRRMVASVEGEEALSLLRGTLWHQALTGATIYSHRVCEWVHRQGGDLCVKSNFPQLSVMLGYASGHAIRIGWFGDPCILSVVKKSYWRARAIAVFVDDWTALISHFPSIIPQHHWEATVKAHSAQTNLFNVATLLRSRSSGFTWAAMRRPEFRAAMHLPRWKLIGLLSIPRPLVSLILWTHAKLRRSDSPN